VNRYLICGEFNATDDQDGTWLWWNNTDGWGDLASATVFTNDERKTFLNRMPQGSWGWVLDTRKE